MGLTGGFREINMGLPMTISVHDVDGASYYNNGTEDVQEEGNKKIEESEEGVEGVPMESSMEDNDDDTSQLEGNSDEEGKEQTPLPVMTGHHASVTESFHTHYFRVHQLRGEQQPMVPTAFLSQPPQLALVRNGQLCQFQSKYGFGMWALVNIQHRPSVVPTRASVEGEFWRQEHWARRRRGRKRMLGNLDHHVRHDNLGQRSLPATPAPWNIASGQVQAPSRYNSGGSFP